MSNTISKGWISVRLEDIVISRKGKKPDIIYREPAKGRVPYILIDEMEGRPVRYYADDKGLPIASKEDVLVVWDGSIGKCARGLTGAIGSTIVALTPRGIESRLLEAFIKRSRSIIHQTSRGTGLQHINQKVFWDLEVPIPPINEQHRLLNKLEELLEKVDASEKRLAKILIILKRFRQSVLAAACSGRLTADWRELNPDAEPYTIGTELTVDGDEDFPPNWQVTRLGKLTTLVTSGSRGWAKYYSDSGSIFVRAQNINSDVLNLEDIAFVTLPGHAEGLRTKVKQYDLLVTITGANVTKTALVEKPLEDAYVSQHVALVRLAEARLSRFVFYSVISLGHGRKQLQTAAYGQGKPGLNLDNIRDIVVGLPPLLEQQEIVRRVQELFSLADRLEERYKKAKIHIDKLTQSILAKAFRGELVPQDSKDEPAEVLLNRIKNESPINKIQNRSKTVLKR